MTRSMTAFGRIECTLDEQPVCWEIRSVNHRYLEASFRMPDACRHLEIPLRDMLRKQLQRGKVECTLRLGERRADANAAIDAAAARMLQQHINHLQSQWPELASPSALDVLKWPGIMAEPDKTDSDDRDTPIREAFTQALTAHIAQREQEGAALAAIMREKLNAMGALVQTVEAGMPAIHKALELRLRDRLAAVTDDIDNNRLEQELVYLAQKMDIAEELDRLRTHITEINRALDGNEPCGRRLDFLMQELNREANTLGSKSVDASTSQASVELKVLIEQVREQVQNIE
ncbi:MAG TPA: YicC/YloC family endoribonuclease [Pseudomonadales bacterium]